MQGIPFANAIWGGNSVHHLSHRFATLTASVGRNDAGSGWEARTIRFFADNNPIPIRSVTVQGSHFATESITIDVRNVWVLRIEIEVAGANGVSVVLGNAIVHPTATTAPSPTPTPTPTPTPSPTPAPTPAPLLVTAQRIAGAPDGFAAPGVTVNMSNIPYTNSIWGGGWSTHGLNNRFNTLIVTIGRRDGTAGTAPRTVTFRRDDGSVIQSVTVDGSFTPMSINVNVSGVTTLRIDIDDPGADGTTIVLGSPIVQ